MKNNRVICGELIYESKKYYFNFRNKILIIQPESLTPYVKWRFEKDDSYFNKRVNVIGETQDGKYVSFINVKFSPLGRGIYQAFVPSYIVGESNTYSPLPECDKITDMLFTGKCLDKFYYPKKNIKENDFYKEEILKLEVDYKNWQAEKFTIDGDTFSYYCHWTSPISYDILRFVNSKIL